MKRRINCINNFEYLSERGVNMNIDLKGKKAIVTGGTRGIGKSIVSKMIDSGCKVIYTGTNEKPKSTIKNTIYKQLDLSDKKSINQFINDVIKESDKIDILVNNAGINIIESIDKINFDNWQKILSINLTSPMCLMREISKIMRKYRIRGKILNISSIFGYVSKSKRSSYSASKFGLIGLTKSASLDLAPYNVLVNALCPGFTLTELTKSILSDNDINRLKSQIPLGRFAKVEEIANVALFLCSDLNTYITGQTIIVDGGFTSQ
jgi:3-oxoacyl-[acyl-carrier protein] reductase